jgi:hypothetical protein
MAAMNGALAYASKVMGPAKPAPKKAGKLAKFMKAKKASPMPMKPVK